MNNLQVTVSKFVREMRISMTSQLQLIKSLYVDQLTYKTWNETHVVRNLIHQDMF